MTTEHKHNIFGQLGGCLAGELGIDIDFTPRIPGGNGYFAMMVLDFGTTRPARFMQAPRAKRNTRITFPCWVQPQYAGIRCIGSRESAWAFERFFIRNKRIQERLQAMRHFNEVYDFTIIPFENETLDLALLVDPLLRDETQTLAIAVTDVISQDPLLTRNERLRNYVLSLPDEDGIWTPRLVRCDSSKELADLFERTAKRSYGAKVVGLKVFNESNGYTRSRGWRDIRKCTTLRYKQKESGQ